MRYSVNEKYIQSISVNHTIVPFGAIWWNKFHPYNGYFKSILKFKWKYSWKSETWLVTDKLSQVTFEGMACLTVEMVQITEIYSYLHCEKIMHEL